MTSERNRSRGIYDSFTIRYITFPDLLMGSRGSTCGVLPASVIWKVTSSFARMFPTWLRAVVPGTKMQAFVTVCRAWNFPSLFNLLDPVCLEPAFPICSTSRILNEYAWHPIPCFLEHIQPARVSAMPRLS